MAFIGAIISWVVGAFQVVSDAILTALVFAYHFLRAFAGDIWTAAKFSYQNILKPIGVWLDRVYQRAVALYAKFVQPVINWLDRVTATLRRIYMTVLAPILSTIDGLQRVLKLLELLHVAWAQQLDDELTALERKLSLPLQLAIQFINSITNRIESYVLTAENLFQRVTHLNTLRRDIGAVQNIGWNALMRNVAPRLSGWHQTPAKLAPLSDADAHLDSLVNGNGEAVGVDVSAALQEFDAWVQAS